MALPSAATASEPTDYAGKWTFDEASTGRADAEKAIEVAAEAFPKLFRGLVRRKLEPAARIVDFFDFAPGPDSITVNTSASRGWTTDLSGTPVPKLTDKGEAVMIKRWMEGGRLHSHGGNDNGGTTYVFTLESPERLRVDVKVEAERLPEPLAFSLRYLRAP